MDNELQLTDLIDENILQQIQDAFSRMTGIASIITDVNGVAITRGTNFSELCNCTRTSDLGCIRCEQCDKAGATEALEKRASVCYQCHTGLVDFAAPIMTKGRLIGCFIGGQVLTDKLDEESLAAKAVELGVDPDKFIAASKKIKIISNEELTKTANFLYTVTNVISTIAYHKYQAFQSNVEVEKAARMKSDFLANMSHEIRTPMNAVIGMAEMALREELSPDARDYITQIKDSGKTLLTIINDILDFSKIESGKMDITPVEYDPLSVISDITNIIMTRIGNKDVELIVDIAPDVPSRLYGDNIRIKQIIVNLSNNAVKFTKEGQVLLSVKSFKNNDDEAELFISVKDTGIGIKKEDISKLFQSFQQVDSKRNRNIEGTGLGLAISKQLVSLMDGRIGVTSEYGVGSTFSFSVPQKIVSSDNCIEVKSPLPIKAVCLVANPYVKEQLDIDITRLGAACTMIKNFDEIQNVDCSDLDFLFVEHILFSKQVSEFVKANPSITAVLMINFSTTISYDIPNLIVVKKPLYSMNIAAIFNHEDLHTGYNDTSKEAFQFIAPEAKILVVDDNAINLTVAEGLLKPLQMNIDTALSGEEAIGKIAAKRYDIIFMDHMMPGLDGVETTHIIRRFHEEYNNIPIIALTANAVEGTKDMFLKEGMNDFVAKPIEVNVITEKIRSWLPPEKIQKISPEEARMAAAAAPAPDKNEASISIEGLDTKSALSLLGSEELFWTVLKDYYKVIPKKIAIIKNYELSESCREYTIEVHALKSASRQIGATGLSEKAASLEDAGNAQDWTTIHKRTDEMLAEYQHYHEILSPYFPEDVKSDKTLGIIDSAVLKDYFSQMKSALDELDFDVMDEVMSKLTQYEYGDDQMIFEQLQNAVEDMDMDACCDIISEWETLI